jgi:hypothetical protein
MLLEFRVIGQQLTRTDKNQPVAGSKNYLKAHFSLPSDYLGLTTAYFKIFEGNIETGTPVPLDDTYTCNVPDDVIDYPGFYVSLSSSETSFIPTNQIRIGVDQSGVPTTILPLPNNTQNQYAMFQELYQDTADLAVETHLNADNAKLSENNAKLSETNSKTSENNAKTSENNSKLSEKNAKASETVASQQSTISAQNAQESAASAQSALESKNSANQSALTATQKAQEAKSSADKINLTDTVTGVSYKTVIINGNLFLEVI